LTDKNPRLDTAPYQRHVGLEHIELMRSLSTMLDAEIEPYTNHAELRLDFLLALKEYIEAKIREENL
jgi:hypothetical protein